MSETAFAAAETITIPDVELRHSVNARFPLVGEHVKSLNFPNRCEGGKALVKGCPFGRCKTLATKS